MRSTVSRWLPAIRRNTVRTGLLGAAALAVGLGVAAGPAPAASAAPASGGNGAPPAATAPAGDSNPTTDHKAAGGSTKDTAAQPAVDKAGQDKAAQDKTAADKAAADKTAADKAAADKAAADKTAADKAAADRAAADKAAAEKAAAPAPAIALGYDFHNQPNYYYCGPAATRIALTSHGKVLSFDQVAGLLGTTTNGTNSAEDITRVLNSQLGAGRYHTTGMPARPNSAHMDQMRNDIVRALNQGDPVVANVAGTVTDTAGEVHSYEGGHYLTVVGYFEGGGMVTIADPADTVGKPTYQLTTAELAKWVGTRGYSS